MIAQVDAVTTAFELAYGYGADGVWSAPGRVNLIGEHTDYNGGLVLPFAIASRTWCAARVRGDRTIRVRSYFASDEGNVSLDELEPAALEGWAAYPLGVAWALIELGAVPEFGVDLYIISEVPVGAGLSSSAAIESAVAMALNDLWKLDHDAMTLARVGRRAENVAVGAPTGIMDQVSSLMGREDHVVFIDCETEQADLVPLDLASEGLAVLVMDTHVKHSHATGGYGERRASCERGAAAMGVEMLRGVAVGDLARAQTVLDDETLRRVRHVVTENARVEQTVATLRAVGPRGIGELLTQSHESMRDDFEISVPELDLAVSASLAAGALGARMTGGGFGGAAIALVEADAVESVAAAVTTAFTAAGYNPPECFTVAPSEGARRDA